MSEPFDPDAYLAEGDEFDPDAYLAEGAPQEAAPPAKDKLLPMSALGATLKAMGQLPNQRLGGLTPWLMEKVGATAQPVQRAGAPEVGGTETALNKAVNMVPLGGVATDLGAAGSLLLGQKAGKIAPDVSRALSGLTGRLLPEALQLGPVPGPGAVLTPEAVKELAALGVDTKEPEAGAVNTYRRLRDTRRTRTEAGEEQNPLAAMAGTGAGLGLGLLGPLPKFTPAGGAAASTGAKIAAGAKTGTAYGGIAGLTSGDADTAGGDFAGTAMQGVFGAGLGSLLGGSIPAAGAFGNWLLRGVVQPTPAAQALQREGVRGLTLGQMDPRSTIGVLESANRQVPGFGTALAGQREVAQSSVRIAALNKARPPGMPEIPQNTPVPEAMKALQRRFDRVYREIDEAVVPTLPADRMLTAMSSPSVRASASATDAAVRDAEGVIQNQMTLLPPAGTDTTAGLLRTIRSNIRTAIRDRISSDDSDSKAAGRLLQEAERSLTRGISDALPGRLSRRLRTADQRYGQYKILEDAVLKAKDPVSGMGEFTPQRLSTSVQQAAQNRGSVPDYVGGGGGPLRQLAANAAQSFEDVPPTGLRSLLAGGWLGKNVAAPLLYFGNRPGVRPSMLGQAPWQQRARVVESALQRYLSRLNTPPQTLAPQALFEYLRTPQETP